MSKIHSEDRKQSSPSLTLIHEMPDPRRIVPLALLLTTTANVPAASSVMPSGLLNLAFVAIPLVDPADPATPARVDTTPEDRMMRRMTWFA